MKFRLLRLISLRRERELCATLVLAGEVWGLPPIQKTFTTDRAQKISRIGGGTLRR